MSGCCRCRTRRALSDLPIATRPREPLPPLDGYTFEGFRNSDGSVGTRNILGITTTVQCVSGVVEFAVRRIKAELLPRFPERRRRGRARAHIWLRRRDRCTRRRRADPHPAQHQPQSEFRRRHHGGRARLREAAAGAAAAAGHASRRRRVRPGDLAGRSPMSASS